MTAEQDKCGDVPAHDEHTNGHAHDGGADRIHITKVFRCKKQGISTKIFHEGAVYNAEHDHPEQKQYLVFPEMKKKQLYG